MNEVAIESIGYVSAAILNTSAIPQIIKTYRTRTAKDLSWGFFGALLTGLALNMTYGALIDHAAIYIGSGISLGLYGSVAYMKYYFEKNDRPTPSENVRAPIVELPLSS